MRADEAPEKIYLIRNISTPTSLNTTNDCHEKYLKEWYREREKDADIEYTRTDTFIERACELLVDCIKDFIARRMEMWDEECKKQTLENLRNALKE